MFARRFDINKFSGCFMYQHVQTGENQGSWRVLERTVFCSLNSLAWRQPFDIRSVRLVACQTRAWSSDSTRRTENLLPVGSCKQ